MEVQTPLEKPGVFQRSTIMSTTRSGASSRATSRRNSTHSAASHQTSTKPNKKNVLNIKTYETRRDPIERPDNNPLLDYNEEIKADMVNEIVKKFN